jgi:methionyl-tRNA formyltransferase
MRLGFAGTPEFAVPALDALNKVGLICGVFTQPDRPAGRGRMLHRSPVKARAAELGLTVYQPHDFKTAESLQILHDLRVDVLVVVAYGLILPPTVLACPRFGCINIHASLLPRWRGAAPIQRALLAGDARTGVTIMRMQAGLDKGPMLMSRAMDIGAGDTAKFLHDRLAALGAELIVETINALEGGGLREQPQPDEGVTYARKIDKAEALIDWRQDAMQISRQIRAFNPWPIAETRFGGAQLRIWDAELRDAELRDSPRTDGDGDAGCGSGGAVPGTVIASTPDGIDVACGRGALRITRLQLAGRKPLLARDFIKGQPLEHARFAQA